MDIRQYYTDLQTALNNVELMIVQTEQKITDEYDAVDYSRVLFTLYGLKRNIKRMLVVHKIQGFSKEEFVEINTVENSGTIVVDHTIKSWETITSIAKLYNANISDILTYNNIKSDELITGTVIKVRTSSNTFINGAESNKDVPVYGSRVGENVYGKDWPDELVANSDGTDVKILEPIETLKQGITNRLSTRSGDYPLESDFGISLVGSEYPQELRDGLLSIEVSQQLELDPRIESIENVIVTSESNSSTIEVVVKAIAGTEQITVAV